jgi:hypothetical protein
MSLHAITGTPLSSTAEFTLAIAAFTVWPSLFIAGCITNINTLVKYNHKD